jgi:predicted metal-dependent hydrolase
MFTVNDEAVGPHQPGRASIDRDLAPGAKPRWQDYFAAARKGVVPGPLRFARAVGSPYLSGFHPSQLGGVERAVDYIAISPAARASH